MNDRAVALIVHEYGNCPLLQAGDRWVIAGREVRSATGSKLCCHALSILYPKLADILRALPSDAPLPDDYLLCGAPDCDAAFRMEFAPNNETGIVRRLESHAPGVSAVLRRSGPFMSRLPRNVASDLIRACHSQAYEDGQIILKQGVTGDFLFIVAQGKVEVGKVHGDDITILVTLEAGECFGEMSILTSEVTSAEVRAKGIALILQIQRDELEVLLQRHPMLSREFSKLLAERLKATNATLQNELNRGIIGRLSMIALPDLVQALQQSRRSGTLVLNNRTVQARMGFREGMLRSAVTPNNQGDEAFYEVICWPDGDFCFEPGEPDLQAEIRVKADNMSLLMEGMRRMDEARSSGNAH